MKTKENIYLDLSKLSGEEIKEVEILSDDSIDEIRYYPYFFWNGSEWDQCEMSIVIDLELTEISLSEFRQLFSKGEEVLQVDIYSGELNTERISMYKKLSEQYNIEESTVRDIFNAGADWVNKLKFK